MGIFDKDTPLFARYGVTLRFRDKIMGGAPKDPKVIVAWLRSKMGLTDEEEILFQMRQVLAEEGIVVGEKATLDEMIKASEEIAATKSAVGFRFDENGLFIEARQVKAMLKECTNILYAGSDGWGLTNKGPKNYVAERVFVYPDRIYLGVKDASGIDLFIGHVSGPSGIQSTLTHYEYVQRATVEFEVMITQDSVEHARWPEIWVQAQENGLGALRSQGHGRFDIERWQLVRKCDIHVKPKAKRETEPVRGKSKNGKIEPPAVLELAR